MEPVVGELQGPSGASSNLLGLPELCPLDTDDELLGLGGIKPKSSPIPRRRSSVSSCSEDESQPPPSSSRRVSFADAFGFSLISVKQFDTWSVCDPSDPLEGDPNDTKEYILNLQFALPLSQDELLCKVREQKIELESVEILPGTTTLKGTVRVLNLCFDKLVYIRTSLDCWSSHFDLLAQFLPGSNSRDTDCFLFKLTLVPPFGEQGARVDFCLRYETPLGTFWASNGGKNYVLFCHEKVKEQEDNENKCKPKSCLKPTSYCFRSKNGTTSSTEEHPEIIFNCETAAVNEPVSIVEEKLEEDVVKQQVENCRNQNRKSRRKAARMAKIQQYFAQREQNDLHQMEKNTGDVTSDTNLNKQLLAMEGATQQEVFTCSMLQKEITETGSSLLTESDNYEEQKCNVITVNTMNEQVSVAQTQASEKEHNAGKLSISQAASFSDSKESPQSPVGCDLQMLEKRQSDETLTEQTALLMQDLQESKTSDKSITKSVEKAWECFEKDAVKKTGGTLDVNITESKAGHEENTVSNNNSVIQPSNQKFTFATIVAPLYHQVFERLENERRDPMSRAQKCKAGEYSGKLEDGSLRAVTYLSYPRVQCVEPRPNLCISEKQDVYQGTCKKTCSKYLLSQKDKKPAVETKLHDPGLSEILDSQKDINNSKLKETQAVTSMQTILSRNMQCQQECSPNTISWEESMLDQAEEMAEMILQDENLAEISSKPSIHILPYLDTDLFFETRPNNEVPKQDNQSEATSSEFLDESLIAIPDSFSANVKPGINQDGPPIHLAETTQIQNQTTTSSKLMPDTTGTNLFQELERGDLHHVATETESKRGERSFHSTTETAPSVVFPETHKERLGNVILTNHLMASHKTKDTNLNLDLNTDQQSEVTSNKSYTSILAEGEATAIYVETKWNDYVDKTTNQDLTNIKECQSEEVKIIEDVKERTDVGIETESEHKALRKNISEAVSSIINYRCALPHEEADISVENIYDKCVHKNKEQDPIVMKIHHAEIIKDTCEVNAQLEDKVEVILQSEPALFSASEVTRHNTDLQNKNIPISLDCKILTQQSELDSTSGKSSAVHTENLPSENSLVTNLCFKNRPCDKTSKDKDGQPKTAEQTLKSSVMCLEESHIPIPNLLTHFNILSSDISHNDPLLKFEKQTQYINQTQNPNMTPFSCSEVHVTQGTNSIFKSNYISQEVDSFLYVDRERESGSGKNDEECIEERTLTLTHPVTENTQANETHSNLGETLDTISQSPQHVSQISMTGNQVSSILNLNFNDKIIDSIRTLTRSEDQMSTVNFHKSASSENEAVKANELLENVNNSKVTTGAKQHQSEDINKVQENLEGIVISEHSLVSNSEDIRDSLLFKSENVPDLDHIPLSSELDTKGLSEVCKTITTTCLKAHLAEDENLLHKSNKTSHDSTDSYQFETSARLKSVKNSEQGGQDSTVHKDESKVCSSHFHKRASSENDTNDKNKNQELTIVEEHQSEKINKINVKEHVKENNPILESLFHFDIASNVISDSNINSQNLIQGTNPTENNSPGIKEGADLVQELSNSCPADVEVTKTKCRSSENCDDFYCVGTLSATDTSCRKDNYTNPKQMTIDTVPPNNVHISQTNESQESIFVITAIVNNDVEQKMQCTSNTSEQDSEEQLNEDKEVNETDLSQQVHGLDFIKLSHLKVETCCQTETDEAASKDNSENYTLLKNLKKQKSNSINEQYENMDDSTSTESLSDDEMELYLHRLRKTQQPGFKEVVSMAKRPSISRVRTIPSQLPSISEYIDEDQSNPLLDDLTNEGKAELERAAISLTNQEEVVIRQNKL